MRIGKIILLLSIFIPFVAMAGTDYLKKNESFIGARLSLINDRWRPLRVHSGEEGYLNSNVNEDLLKRGFIEAFACSVDTSNCDFFYKKNGKCLRLITVGEEIRFMKVVRWSEECPPREY